MFIYERCTSLRVQFLEKQVMYNFSRFISVTVEFWTLPRGVARGTTLQDFPGIRYSYSR